MPISTDIVSYLNPWPLRPARVRHWLRWLLACALFSALHSPVGAWVVSTIGHGPVVQVCTPQGMQWVQLDELGSKGQLDDTLLATAQQPCVWTAAHSALEPLESGAVPGDLAAGQVYCQRACQAPPPNDHAQRVLLMSAMRAPPAPQG